MQKLAASDSQGGAGFGYCCSIDGDFLVIGAPFHDSGSVLDVGAAYVFVRTASGWAEQQKLSISPGLPNGVFGAAVSVNGARTAIGGLGNAVQTGAAHIFERNGGSWSHASSLSSSDVVVGDGFAASLVLGRDELLVGALYSDHSGLQDAGAVYQFESVGGVWLERDKLTASDAADGAWFGTALAMDGGRAVVGAPGASNNPTGLVQGAGQAYVFARGGTGTWKQFALLYADDPDPMDRFGLNVAAFGCRVAVASPAWEKPGHAASSDQGAVYVFKEPALSKTYCTAGTSRIGCTIKLSSFGAPSATATSGFVVGAGSVPGATTALAFLGTGGRSFTPWVSPGGSVTSFRCFQPPAFRLTKPLALSGSGSACNSVVAVDVNSQWCPTCPRANVNPGEGAMVQLQIWIRDPNNLSNTHSVLSDALEFCVGP